MRSLKYLPMPASLLLALGLTVSANAQAPNFPYVEMDATAVSAGIGGSSGEGVLRLPNLGTNCEYPFRVAGFGAGVQVGLTKVSASGAVQNMTRVSDLAGDYSAAQGDVTVLAGGGVMTMKNRRNNVAIDLKSNTQGLSIGFGGQGMSIQLSEPPVNAPRTYVLTFGFNKTWVNAESRATLDQLVRAWKCHYANIWLFGHTDTVGREDSNVDLSAQRATAVRDYLVGAGVFPARVGTIAKGDSSPLVATANQVRLRSNRAVVILVQQ